MNRYPVKPLNLASIALIAALLFIPFGGQVPLFDWDEINFAESAREMLVTGNFSQVTVNYEPFWEKPPLFIWLQALSMKVFGVNEFAARFPNALAGIATLCLVFFIGTRYFRGHVGEGWLLAYAGSLFPHFYFNTGLIDPLFNLFIFGGIFQIYLAIHNGFTTKYFIRAGLFTGLAILTKGPVALLISVLVLLVFSLVKRKLFYISPKHWLTYLLPAFVVSSLWFVPEIINNGIWFLKEFILYQIELASQDVAGHAQPFYYHFLVLLIGCFPASVIAFSAIKEKNSYERQEADFKLFMGILFLAVLLLFSLIRTKIVHYSSLCWLPLSFFAGLAFDGFLRKKSSFRTWQKALLTLLLVVWIFVFALLPLVGTFDSIKNTVIPFIKDDFVTGNLSVNAGWTGWELLPVIAFAVASFYALSKIFKNCTYRGVRLLFFTNLIFIPVYSVWVVPKAERHIQGSVIDFYKSIAEKDVYVATNEKSYAPYFYAKVKPLQETDGWYAEKQAFISSLQKTNERLDSREREALDNHKMQWLMDGNIDKNVYIVSKVQKASELRNHPNFTLILEEGGYTVFVRKR